MATVEWTTPVSKEEILKVRVGDIVYISGEILTARDRAHERALKYLEAGKKLPIDLNGAVVFYCGPLIKKIGERLKIVSCGPTTTMRMNGYIREIVKRISHIVLVGKGEKGNEIAEALRGKGVFLAFPGGVGALAARAVKSINAIHWEDLGLPEAVWVLEVEKLGPCVVAIDAHGNNIYEEVERRVEENFRQLLVKIE